MEKYGRDRQAIDSSMKWLMTFVCKITKARIQTHTHTHRIFMLFHSKFGCVNAPQCYIICTLSLAHYWVQSKFCQSSVFTEIKTNSDGIFTYL